MFKIGSEKLTRKDVEDYCLMDDIFLSVVFENKDCSEHLINTILDKELSVFDVKTQFEIKNLQGHSVKLDIYAQDTNGKIYDVEIENVEKRASPQRARYYSSSIDLRNLKTGKDFIMLPETYVIFITKSDILGDDKPIYHIERTILETGKNFNDNSHIIYVNSAIKDDTPLGQLMHDLQCKNANDMHSSVLADRVRYFKESKEGVEHMDRVVTNIMKRNAIESVKDMYTDGLTLDKICKYVRVLTFDEVKAICEKEDKKQTSSTSSQYTHNFT